MLLKDISLIIVYRIYDNNDVLNVTLFFFDFPNRFKENPNWAILHLKWKTISQSKFYNQPFIDGGKSKLEMSIIVIAIRLLSATNKHFLLNYFLQFNGFS